MFANIALDNVSISGSSYVGGISGVLNNSKVTGSYVIGSVTGNNYVGGIVGDAGNSEITGSYSAGSVTGNLYVGGIAGFLTNSSEISGSYSTGSVTGTGYIGGIAGHIRNDSAVINNAAANPTVSGGSFVGRVAGSINSDAGNVTGNIAYDNMSRGSGAAFNTYNANYGDNRTLLQLYSQSTYESLLWDFDTLWVIDEGNDFPVFQYQPKIVKIVVGGVVTEIVIDNGTFTVPLLPDDSYGGWNSMPDGTGTDFAVGTNIPVNIGFKIYAITAGLHPNYPIKIYTADNMSAVRDNLSLHYRLADNISLSGYSNWIPIGSNSTNDDASRFTGTFDGAGYKISDLTIDNSLVVMYAGLFGYVNNAVLTGIVLDNVSIIGIALAGGVVGLADNSKITGSCVTGSVTGNNPVGGIAGYINNSEISGSCSSGSITGSNDVGGIAGYVDNSTVTGSYSVGSVTVTGNSAGGIAGYVQDSEITVSYSAASVTGNNSIGGIAGVVTSSAVKNNAAANPLVSGDSYYVGRVVGYINSGADNITSNIAYDNMSKGSGAAFTLTLANHGTSKTLAELQTKSTYTALGWDFINIWKMSYGGYPIFKWQRDTSGVLISSAAELNAIRDNLSGAYVLAADISLAEYDNWEPIGNNSTSSVASRFTGRFNGNGYTISDLNIDNDSRNYVGLFGYADNAALDDIVLDNVSVRGNEVVGGIAGYLNNSEITGSCVTGSVNGVGYYVGGIVGVVGVNGKVTGCWSAVSVNGDSLYVGGITGYLYYGEITDSYSTGSVNGISYLGGIAGNANNSRISSSYSIGSITGMNSVGSIAGYSQNSAIRNNAAASLLISGIAYVGRVVGEIYSGADNVTDNIAYDAMSSGSGAAFTLTTANHGTSKTLMELQTESTYTTLGWDFVNVWKMPDSGYPVFRW